MALVGGIPVYLLVVELFNPEVHFLKKGSSSPEVMPLKVFLLSFTAMTLFLIWFVRRQMLWEKGPQALKSPASRLLNRSLATNLLCEAVAISGLTLSLLTGSPLSFYPFMLLSLVLFAYFFPRYAQWKEWVGKFEAVENPIFWLHPSLLQMPELHQGGTPAPALFAGQPEGSHLRDSAQDGMYRSA
jgi:uncharacterized membrane protein YbaN (DUF454 family)